MRYTLLGRTGEKLPIVGLGMGKGIGGFAKTAAYGNEDEKCVRLAVELGMTFVDVAYDYGLGQAEEALGRAVRGIREKVFIATKFPPEKSSFEGVVDSAEASLKRLGTDRIDLFQSHWPNPQVPLEETLRAMEKLVHDGKVRFIGLGNCTTIEAEKARAGIPNTAIVSIQNEYNLLDRTAESRLIPYCAENGMTFIGYSPLAHLREGKADRRLAALEKIAERYDISTTQLVLNWLTRHGGNMVLMRSSSARHLRDNARTGDVSIDPEDLLSVSSIFAGEVREIPASRIRVRADGSDKVYTTLEAARANIHGLTPSPAELAEQIMAGEMLKPIKLCADGDPEANCGYHVAEGKLRYWAWVIAGGQDVLIPSIIKENGDS